MADRMGIVNHMTVQGIQQNSHSPQGVGQSMHPVFGPLILTTDEVEELDEIGKV